MNRTKVFETERLILRPFKETDAEDMFKNYCNSEEVCEFLTWKPHGTLENTKAYLNNVVLPDYENERTYRWAVVLKETNEVIGTMDFVSHKPHKAFFGWVIGKDYWGHGYMPETARVLVNYLFEEGFERIEAWHNVKNPKSGRAMQKIGMKFEGLVRKFDVDNNGIPVDCNLYSIIKGDKII